MNNLLKGAVAGTLATVPMTATMLALHRRLPEHEQYKLPPREITQVLALKSGQHRRLEPHMKEASLLAHFGYGAATGALFCLLMPRCRNRVVHGAVYGLTVWGASYLGWIPAAGILRPATQHPARRNAMMLAAHLVWGGSLAWLQRHFERRD